MQLWISLEYVYPTNNSAKTSKFTWKSTYVKVILVLGTKETTASVILSDLSISFHYLITQLKYITTSNFAWQKIGNGQAPRLPILPGLT